MSKEKQENHDFTAYDYMSVDPTEGSLKSLTKIVVFSTSDLIQIASIYYFQLSHPLNRMMFMFVKKQTKKKRKEEVKGSKSLGTLLPAVSELIESSRLS